MDVMTSGFPMPDMLDMSAVQMDGRDEASVVTVTKQRGRKKKAKFNSPPLSLLPTIAEPLDEDGKHIVDAMVNNAAVGREQMYMAIGRFLYEAGVPLEAVKSVYFQHMVGAIAAAGPGLEMLSYHDFRGWMLKRSMDEVKMTLQHYRGVWNQTGCSLLADEWTTETGKTLINFLVYCPDGTAFLRTVDASHIVTSAENLFELLRHVVEEVGPKNVVQVITNNTETHVQAAEKLMHEFPTLFWAPCASHCIEEMLKDISKMDAVNEIIENAKLITSFIYNRAEVLNLTRKYTSGKDLLLLSENHCVMSFLTLRRLTSLKEELRAMVTSQDWAEMSCAKRPGGLNMANLVSNMEFWSSCTAVVRIVEPLLFVLRLVESNKRPAMGYIYAAMHHVKQAIKKELVSRANYTTYLDIIDWRWNKSLPRPLYAAGFFLNPQFFYSIKGEISIKEEIPFRGEISSEISSAVLDCIEKFVPENLQDKTIKELNPYKASQGDFGRKMAVRATNTLLPAEWWSTYGGGCPNLMRLAIRVLSQTCSARGCDRARIPFEQIHSERTNNLEHQRLCDLVFVQYNLRLQQRHSSRSRPSDPISIDNIGIADDWVVEELSGDTEYGNWMALDQPVPNGMLSGYTIDDEEEAFIAVLDDEVVRGAGLGEQVEDQIKEEEEGHDNTTFT